VIISTHSINLFVFVTEKEAVYCTALKLEIQSRPVRSALRFRVCSPSVEFIFTVGE
jgi:hypothetical protein